MPILLKAGVVLRHDANDNIIPTKADVLIEGNRITRIEESIPSSEGCEVIDSTDKIVSPGFIDTHHHVWQSAFKGLFGDMALLPYLAISKNTISLSHSFRKLIAVQPTHPASNLQRETCFGPTFLAAWKQSTPAQPRRWITRT